MAKFQTWKPGAAPAGGGPIMPRNPNASLPGQAIAQVGGAIAQVGLFLTVQAREAEEKTQALDRARQVSALTREAGGKLDDLWYALNADPDTDSYESKFRAVETELTASLDAVTDDEVKTRLQQELDKRLDVYRRNILGLRQETRIRNWEAEYAQAAEEAVRRNDVSLVQVPLDVLLTNNLISQAEADARLQEVNDQARIWNTALQLGWKEGLAYINQESTWQGTSLEADEIAALQGRVRENLSVRQSLEARDERQAALQVADNERKLIGAALGGQLSADEAAEIPRRIAAGEISEQTGRQALALVKTGPPTENDPATAEKAFRLVDDVQTGRMTSGMALSKLNQMSSRLTPGFRDARIADLTDTSTVGTALRDASVRARRELVTVSDETLTWADLFLEDEELKKKARQQRIEQERLLDYHDNQLRQWRRDNPTASAEDVYAESERIRSAIRPMGDQERQSLLEGWTALTTKAEVQPSPAAVELLPPALRDYLTPNLVPLGLESIWNEMTDEEKGTALQALAQGMTPEQIIAYWSRM